MNNNNRSVEIVLLPNHMRIQQTRKEIMTWFTMTLQPEIDRQQEGTGKVFLKSLKKTPAIFMS